MKRLRFYIMIFNLYTMVKRMSIQKKKVSKYYDIFPISRLSDDISSDIIITNILSLSFFIILQLYLYYDIQSLNIFKENSFLIFQLLQTPFFQLKQLKSFQTSSSIYLPNPLFVKNSLSKLRELLGIHSTNCFYKHFSI